ncbi:HAD-IIB family hydrolase [Hirschia litorea]|uniref:HAD-IIB family hydrolase n=1 Tax=Hirschia litorea TaxID=1199156 RepID=A0ABW2II07_9PROT
MSNPPNFIVFTDLDGTLLDHSNYSYKAASDALHTLHESNIPLILASSKTAVEISSIRAELGFDNCPAIVENGAGILPAGPLNIKSLDRTPYRKLIKIINDAPAELRCFYEGFSDWTADKISKVTGLPFEDATKSSQRQFSEPGLWKGDAETREQFVEYLNSCGVSYRHGGRFMTLSFGANKGIRVGEIINTYSNPQSRPLSLALGDAPNDVEMIQATDFGVIIPNAHGNQIPRLNGEETGKISRAQHAGPVGWNVSVLQFLNSPPTHQSKI